MPARDVDGLLEELRATLYSIGDGVITTDATGCIRRMNPTAEKLTGWSETAAVGLPLTEVFIIENEETGVRIEDPVSVVLREKKIVGLANHTQIVTRLGQRVPIADSGAPIVGADGELLGVVLVFRDQSVEREKEQRIIESEARFRSFYEYSPMGMHFYELQENDDFVFCGANPAADRILGFSHADLVGKTIQEAFPQLVHTEIPERYRDCVRNQQIWSIEQMAYRDHRISGVYRITAFPVIGQKMVAIFEDITAMQQLQNQRDEAERKFQQAQRLEAVARLAGGVAHDFNNMLSVINGLCDVLLEDLAPDHPITADIQDIREAGRRSAELIRQLLGFARRQFSAPRLLDLRDVVDPLIGMVRRVLGENVDLQWNPSPQKCIVWIDPAQVDQIVTNLVVNARDALKGTSGRIELSVAPEHDSESGVFAVVLSVKDNGCGMSKKVLEHAFEPFFTTKRVEEGTGLGLSTVHGIVAQNGGRIHIETQLGSGTHVRVFFPMHEGEGGKGTQDSKPATREAASRVVLLVEDEPNVLRIEQRMLEKLGFFVLCASGGEQALEIAQQQDTLHVLLTDVIMPHMNGVYLAHKLCKLYPDLLVVFMSGYAADIVDSVGEFSGKARFLQKPFTLTQLASILQ